MFHHLSRKLYKMITIILCAILLSSATLLPVTAQIAVEQLTYRSILNADLQEENAVDGIQGLSYETESAEQNHTADKYDMTNEQQRQAYQKEIEEEIQNYESNRYIVKYTDEQSVPQFSDGGRKTEDQSESEKGEGK